LNAATALPLLNHNGDGWGHHWWWPVWLVFWAALIATAAWLISKRRDHGRDPLHRAREVLGERFASGELTGQEYRERLDELKRSSR
jgi:putative membrane protein